MYRTALVPHRSSPFGPVTRARRRRAALIYAALFLVGVSTAALTPSAAGKAFGLGLVAPGAGFLLYAAGSLLHAALHVALTLGTLAGFAFALVMWFGSGNVIAPVLVWLGSALAAGAMHHHATWPAAVRVVPLIVLAGLVAQALAVRLQFRAARARGRARNRYLETVAAVPSPQLTAAEELSPRDLSALRFLLDRALQPIDQFNGYGWVEQFQTSSMRYQLMMTSYVLSLTQATRLPAFRGYLSTAQRNLIEKTQRYEVWNYWKLENAWGNLRWHGDPMAPDTHDNVMYSGWFAAMVGMYASNTGDARYAAPGSVTLREPSGRSYVYDWPAVVRILADNFARSDFTLFACEPNWIYPLCNTYAGIGLRLHDRLRGSDFWSRLEADYRKGLDDEFTQADGRLVVIRSSLTGLSVPALSSVMTDAGVAMFQHALLPDVARRTWEIIRRDLLRLRGGELEIRYHGSDFLDVGNYSFSRAGTLACVASLAAEMGDIEIARAALALLEHKHPPLLEHGTLRHPGLSVNTHLLAFSGRVNRANGMHDLVVRGMPDPWRTGPVLEDAEYPYVLVAHAISDGAALELALYPGVERGRRGLGLAQLVPGRRYRCEGALEAEIIADAEGRARVHVELDGRRGLRAVPVL
jgi:Linalool dehydratase/isomerase